MNHYDTYARSQIIVENPIRKEPPDIQHQYCEYLRTLLHRANCDKGKYAKAQLSFYGSLLHAETFSDSAKEASLGSIRPFRFLLPFDVIAILSFRRQSSPAEKLDQIADMIADDFKLSASAKKFLQCIFVAAQGEDSRAWKSILQDRRTSAYRDYMTFIRDNLAFSQKTPYPILITATMSAGKSTLINAFVGKNISLAQNLACTSKIHTIVSKFSEDYITTEYDYELSVNATKEELLTDNSDNEAGQIVVGTYFHGVMGGQRIILYDSPGVNSSENAEHAAISGKLLRSQKYRLLLHVLNATQLGTTDELQHLKQIAKTIGRRKILFVLNKCDHLISEDESLLDVVRHQKEFLESQGFKDPIVCPVSAQAAFLSKKSQQEKLSRLERRELDNYIDRFSQSSLRAYYERELGCAPILTGRKRAEILRRNCGVAYLENIIMRYKEEG